MPPRTRISNTTATSERRSRVALKPVKNGSGLPYKPLEVVKVALTYLSDRDADVIARRNGLRTGEKQTLEEIGRMYQLTRERIRQIENSVINRLKDVAEIQEALDAIGNHIQSVLHTHGKIMEHAHFLDEILGAPKRVDPLDRHAITFLANYLLGSYVSKVDDSKKNREGWKHTNASWELFEGTVSLAKSILREHGEPLDLDSLLVKIRATDFFKKNAENLADAHILSYLRLSQELHHNAFAEWGMAEWPTVRPRRMSDKIYLVLKKSGKPLHFEEITEAINVAGFAGKRAYVATVHNELILDERFVLVGRGTYALSEWGYKPGVVADIIENVMRASKGPMQREEIIAEVLKQRMVKPATVTLALMNKKRFKKVAPKTYYLVK